MKLKGIQFQVGGKLVQLEVPNKKSIILRGSNNVQLMYVVESLLSNSYSDYYHDIDKAYGFYYSPLEDNAMMVFTDGAIKGENKSIFKEGSLPKIHCIRYLNDGVFRSFLCSSELAHSPIYTDLTVYSPALSFTAWIRLCTLVNSVIGRDVVFVTGETLTFNFVEDSSFEFSLEAQKTIYLLMAECFLTPEGYQRVILLPSMDCLTSKQQVKLIETIDNIAGHEVLFSAGAIDFEDVNDDSALTFLTV